MNSVGDLSGVVRASLEASTLTQAQLREQAGVSQRTLTNVLSGREDFKLSTLLAVADRLGLDVVLVPRAASAAVDAGAQTT
jgi:transcriptional regulator with XRE-family HTH domain